MFFNWEDVLTHLKEFCKDDTKIEEIIDMHMMKAVKEAHPKDYESFIEINKPQLEKIKIRIRDKYKNEFCNRISNLFPKAA